MTDDPTTLQLTWDETVILSTALDDAAQKYREIIHDWDDEVRSARADYSPGDIEYLREQLPILLALWDRINEIDQIHVNRSTEAIMAALEGPA